ncbi:MAG: queuosine precursor transporter [Gammaproteobacteria bacterium]|nr:queuosine precursor transporter [Gammaproteobacteria bacterium]
MKDIETGLIIGIIAMVIIVTVSNVLVAYAINDWLTWAAFTYPFAFLVTDLINRKLGVAPARKVVYVGFALAVLLSIYFAGWRIALASGSAFLLAQLLDVQIFDRLRKGVWWRAPLVSSSIASVVDTLLFFSIAFVGTGVPWVTLAAGDYLVKLAMALTMLIPFRVLLSLTRPAQTPVAS